jgi:hypothetical protein
MSTEEIYFDKDGEEYVLDENGNKRPPMQTTKQSKSSSGFTHYDSPIHCGLCGQLTCRGSCFK